MLLLNAKFIDYRLQRMKQWQSKRQAIAKQYDEQLQEYVTIQQTNADHNYHKYVIRLQNKEVRDRLKEKLGAKVHYDKPLSENKMYENIKHKKDSTFISKIVCDSILTLPIHAYMSQQEVDKVINTILIFLDQEENKFVDNMKKLIGDDIFDKTLITETTEPIYDYIVEKIYQSPDYVEDVSLNKRKLKIAFNKFYENITGNTR